MGTDRLNGKRILVTSADDYMGPAIAELFRDEGADVIADTDPLIDQDAPTRLIADVGSVDAIVINLDLPAYGPKATEIDDARWIEGFDAMVHPLMRVVRAAAPGMIEAGGGSMVAITSSSPLRRMRPHATPYVTARAAQNAFVRSAGHELAGDGVRLNAIAQNFVANDTYYPPELMENERFLARLDRDVPAKRLGDGAETAELALFLASERSSFIFGQVISQDGGWS